MNFRYCPNCGKETGHKRFLGIGTVIAVFLTLGLWLLVIPFYPIRCIHCGAAKWSVIDGPQWWPDKKEPDYQYKMENRKIGYAVMGGMLLLFVLVGLLLNKPAKKEPQVQTFAPPVGKPAPEKPKVTPSMEEKYPGLFMKIEDDPQFKKMSPQEHLLAAQKALADKSSNWPFGRTITATKHLEAIPSGGQEYPKALKLLKDIEDWHRRDPLQKRLEMK